MMAVTRSAIVNLVLVLLPLAFALGALMLNQPFYVTLATRMAILALAATGLNLALGLGGLVSFGHAAFFGIGAYAAALVTLKLGVSAELAFVVAGLVAAAAAVVLYAPTIRLTGHTAALATLAIGQIVYLVCLSWIDVTRGPMGIPGVHRPSLGLTGTSMQSLEAQYWQSLAVLAIVTAIACTLIASPIGRTWRAIREDRLAAHASGVPVPRYLTMAFAVSGFLAGLAGAQFAFLQNFVSPDSFVIDTSIVIIAMIVLGGLGNITGAIIGGVLLALLPEALREFAQYRMLAYGAILLLLLRFRPQGLVGTR